MRFAPALLLFALAACSSTQVEAPFPAAQAVVDTVAARHPNLVRLTLHAVPAASEQCTQVASTMVDRRGTSSDPEDMEALRTGQEIVLDEPGAVDVTVPILAVDGAPTAVAGVTLHLRKEANREKLISNARMIAQEMETEIRAAGRPLW